MSGAWRGHGVVLVADDEPSVRTVAIRALTRLGFDVEPAEDGEAALARLRAAPDRYRLVLLDLSMPKLSGADALAAIRQLAPGLRVLVMSGYAEYELGATFASGGPDGFLHKPFDLRSLTEAVRAVLA